MTRTIRARQLHPGVQIKLSEGTKTVADIRWTDTWCGGEGLRTAAALRIDFTDGTFVLAHPHLEAIVVAATYKAAA